MAHRLRLLGLASLATHAVSLRAVLVTGGNKGIGRAICRRIVADHADAFVFLGSRDAARGVAAVESIVADVPSAAGRIAPVTLDVTDDASVAAAAASVRESLPDGAASLYAVCNNAGVGFGRSIAETLATNTYGVKRVCDAFVPLLDPAAGRVVNIASASGPIYVSSQPSGEAQAFFTEVGETDWPALEAEMQKCAAMTDYEGVSYGLSKACLTVWVSVLQSRGQEVSRSCRPARKRRSGRGADDVFCVSSDRVRHPLPEPARPRLPRSPPVFL